MTMNEMAGLLEVPLSTVRLYRDEFEELVPASGEGRRRRYDEEALDILRRIVLWKRQGWTAGQIRDALARERQPQQKARRRNTDERLDEVTALIRAQAGEIAMLRVEMGGSRADLKRLVEAVRADRPPTMEEALLIGRGG